MVRVGIPFGALYDSVEPHTPITIVEDRFDNDIVWVDHLLWSVESAPEAATCRR